MATIVSCIVRYLLPCSVRLRLLVREVLRLREAYGPATFLREHDFAGYMMQVDILQEYYRV